jgi:hypothetical protein
LNQVNRTADLPDGGRGAQLAELEEALAAVIVPHAARADAAERHVVLGHVQHAVVDRDAARHRRVEELLLARLVVREDVEAEGAVPAVHVPDHLFESAIRLHRQERTEDLVLHDDHVVGDVEHEVRRDLPELVVEGHAGDERDDLRALLAGVLERRPEPPVRAIVDHGGVARLVRVGVALRQDARRRGDELVALPLGDEEVVGRETGLPGVQELGVEDARRGLVDVEVVADDRR